MLDKFVRFEVASALSLMILWSLERSESSRFEGRLMLGSIDDKMYEAVVVVIAVDSVILMLIK